MIPCKYCCNYICCKKLQWTGNPFSASSFQCNGGVSGCAAAHLFTWQVMTEPGLPSRKELLVSHDVPQIQSRQLQFGQPWAMLKDSLP